MDRIDRAILRELQRNGRISVVELAAKVNLTKTPCSDRMRRLEAAGVIKRYGAELDPVALEANHVVLVQVVLRGTTADELERFNEAVRRVPEIQSCHMIAGDFDYLLKVRTRDIQHYRRLLGDTISRLPHVQQTHTYVVMETVKDDMTLPVPPGPMPVG
ncbi:ArsR family transcriptional regulator [Skermanella stibiiresistens SB22]|uniref:ArsR family transcriptional regulator n=1 Tax=Skermanella stibiiresistens SB22 TaxID=1385369 RepID=W9H759_9PROT|nr:Lrp/AsnC ligand binding domain-containing protein [Skermanella stibiiresistens]EWY40537.1 ArsR family transcriptional regulator [Skermanella stibiiresistens SB22]